MTVSSEAKRTLVKSPPELWSEVSDAESLARHLDGVQQVRITRVEPETAVEWEADGASGSVRLQPSGFGTKVTLSLSRELPQAEPAAAEPESASEPVAEPEPEPAPEPAPVAEVKPEHEPAPGHMPVSEVEPDPDLVEAEPPSETSVPDPVPDTAREGFFARLLKRRRKQIASAGESIDPLREPAPVALGEPKPEPMPAPELEPAAPVQEAEAASEPGAEAPNEPLAEPTAVLDEAKQAIALESGPAPEPTRQGTGVTADLATLEAEMVEHDEAMLTAMLDRLGAAHHRPFSRS
jgi:hypothetical protein